MLRVETRLVDKRLYNWRQVALVVAFVVLFCAQLLIGGRGQSGLIERNKWSFPFNDPDLLLTFVIIAYFVALVTILYLAYSTHSMGELRFRGRSVKVGDWVVQYEEMKYLKVEINSPKVYGTRNAKQGFDNWIEFATQQRSARHQFYLKDYAMEDALIQCLEEVKNNYGIPVTVNVKGDKPIESWFQSMFGNG